ncbi:MAG TPA: hypothetical protein VN324_00840 [Quisquiliibacterium sp.]|nr:hypothetical protein [Quisquiliibacterium sp.]
MATPKRKAPVSRKALPGRPTKYDPLYAERVFKLCLLGATEAQIADVFGCSVRVIEDWKAAHPDFLQAITRGRIQADAEIAHSLYHRALGYSHPAQKIMQYEGVPVVVDYTEHYPPDTMAASLWLRNRHPGLWRQQPPEDGGEAPTPVKVVIEVKDASTPEPSG